MAYQLRRGFGYCIIGDNYVEAFKQVLVYLEGNREHSTLIAVGLQDLADEGVQVTLWFDGS